MKNETESDNDKTMITTHLEDHENPKATGRHFIQENSDDKDRDIATDEVEQEDVDVDQDDAVTGDEQEEIENEQENTETKMVHDDTKDNKDTPTRGENMENTTELDMEENEETGPKKDGIENANQDDTEHETVMEIEKITRTNRHSNKAIEGNENSVATGMPVTAVKNLSNVSKNPGF